MLSLHADCVCVLAIPHRSLSAGIACPVGGTSCDAGHRPQPPTTTCGSGRPSGRQRRRTDGKKYGNRARMELDGHAQIRKKNDSTHTHTHTTPTSSGVSLPVSLKVETCTEWRREQTPPLWWDYGNATMLRQK